MFAFRFFRPALRMATRTFTTLPRSRTPYIPGLYSQISFKSQTLRPSRTWRTAFQQAQTRQYAAYNYQRFNKSRSIWRRWASRPTFYYEIGGLGALCGGYWVYNLEPVPVSGRKRFNVVSPEFEQQLGNELYEATMNEYAGKILPPYTKEHHQVQRVLNRLIPHSGLEGDAWEIHVIDDPEKNAFVIPGGKVFVFRGILDICQGDDGLAAVLGHEIAHNVAHHSAERMSEYVWILPVGIVAYIATGVDPGLLRMLTNLIFTLPGSRTQEAEADYIGLLMMSESCYDPSAAIGLWSRMEKAEKGAPPQFLSTHPSSHNRMEKIRDWLPEAEVKRESSECGSLREYADEFRRGFEFPRW